MKEDDEIIKRIDENRTLALSNRLIEGKYDTTVGQLKLFIALVSLIKKSDTKFTSYKINVETLIDILNTDKRKIYTTLFEISKNLASKVAYIKDSGKEEFTVYSIFSKIDYKNGVLTTRFNEDTKPFLLQIKKYFTKFKLKEFKPFRSEYSIRIYQLLKQY